MSVVTNFDYTSDSNIKAVAESKSGATAPIMGMGENQNLAGLTQSWDLHSRQLRFEAARRQMIGSGISDTGACRTRDDVAYVETYVNANGVKLFGDCEDNTFLQTLVHTATKLWPDKHEYASGKKKT